MTTLSACFTGPRESKMPYEQTCAEYGKLELVLKVEIIKLIRRGVSEFYTGGQTGIDTLAAMLVVSIRQELMTTANLNLVLPHKNMAARFSTIQKDDFNWIKRSADTVVCLGDGYTSGCYRRRNRYMVEKSDYLIAVAGAKRPYSGTYMTLGMARRKGIETIVIDPLSFEVTREA